jgi:hypothetical protein
VQTERHAFLFCRNWRGWQTAGLADVPCVWATACNYGEGVLAAHRTREKRRQGWQIRRARSSQIESQGLVCGNSKISGGKRRERGNIGSRGVAITSAAQTRRESTGTPTVNRSPRDLFSAAEQGAQLAGYRGRADYWRGAGCRGALFDV